MKVDFSDLIKTINGFIDNDADREFKETVKNYIKSNPSKMDVVMSAVSEGLKEYKQSVSEIRENRIYQSLSMITDIILSSDYYNVKTKSSKKLKEKIRTRFYSIYGVLRYLDYNGNLSEFGSDNEKELLKIFVSDFETLHPNEQSKKDFFEWLVSTKGEEDKVWFEKLLNNIGS